MRRSGLVVLIIAAFWIEGCQEKLPVELTPEQSATALQVSVVPAIDSTLIVDASVDTSGVLQAEEQMYPATFLVNGVKTDYGTSRSTFSYSRILLNDKKKPITDMAMSKVIGYNGIDVGNAKVNTVDLPKTSRSVRTWTSYLPGLNAGKSYMLVDQDDVPIPNFTYTAGQSYRFVADGKNAVSSFSKEINSPDEITVVEPKAGSIAFRNEDLHVRWGGKPGGNVRLLISSFDAKSNVPVKPLLQFDIDVREVTNTLVVPSKLLQSVRANSDGRYLLSFISSNRITTTIPGYDGNVLVQAASIHNVLLWLK
jgi:hypothetical protein